MAGPLLCDPLEKAAIENRNGAEQIQLIQDLVQNDVRVVTEGHVLRLQATAVHDIYPCAGSYRDAYTKLSIANSEHEVPPAALVQTRVLEALDRINNIQGASAIDRAAYALWRFNWIHPFKGGNGRSSRAIAYLIVCMNAGHMLPGVPTMPTLIYEERQEYIKALRAVDESAKVRPNDPDIRAMSVFLRHVMIRQFASAIDAMGRVRIQ